MRFAVLLALLLPLAAPAAPPYPPEVVPGALVIVGGGKMPDEARKEFVKLAGGEDVNLIVVPTASAAADEPKDAEAFTKPWTDAGVKSVTLFHTRDKKLADDTEFVKPLTTATAVWFSGGDQSKVTAAYAGTKAEAEFKNVLARYLRGYTAFFHAEILGIQEFEAGAELGGGAVLVSRRNINLTLDMYNCASLDGYVRS